MIAPIEIPDATTEPQAYVQALLATLGDRDPIAVYRQTPDSVEDLVRDADDEAWLGHPSPGEWSALQIVGHLLDVDVVYGFRWRLVLTEEKPSYPGYNEKAWSELARPAPSGVVAAMTALRRANVALIEGLTEADWSKGGIHAEQGPEDMHRTVQKIAGHDLAHLNQLLRTLASASRRA
jgi:hypothetical protein